VVIGVDATCWANGRGYGRFARELMRAMTRLAPEDQFRCFGDRRAFDAYPDPEPNVQRVEVALQESPTVAASGDSHRAPLDLLRMTRAVWRDRPDVFFSPSVYTYFPLPPWLPAVVTIHDTIPERFPHLTLPSRRARLLWGAKVRFAIAQARIVLTMSEYSAASITRLLGVPRDRIRLCVQAPAPVYRPSTDAEVRAATDRIGLPKGADWFVYVGGFNPHKRVDLILRAHAALAASQQPAPHLLLVGTRGGDVFHKDLDQLDAIVRDAGTSPLVHWLGFVSDEDLRPLLTGAAASLLPSEAEGFGLPAVEAAACGCPVIVTVESPMPHLLRGGGFFVTPGDLPRLQEAMRRLLQDRALRAELGRVAFERASALSWNRAAEQALAAIRESAR
jgi:glycosyltransferase involved in cell wall biosynthesis